MALPFFDKMKKSAQDRKGPAASLDTKLVKLPVVEKTTNEPKKKFPISEHALMLRPVMTEKSFRLSMTGKYVFEVAPSANKISVKKAFFNMYGVMPIKVAIIRLDGKLVRFGRLSGKQKEWKKAIVTVKKGEQVNVA